MEHTVLYHQQIDMKRIQSINQKRRKNVWKNKNIQQRQRKCDNKWNAFGAEQKLLHHVVEDVIVDTAMVRTYLRNIIPYV